MIKPENTEELCKWLRDNSSGCYRNSDTAAYVIETLTARNQALKFAVDGKNKEIQSLTDELEFVRAIGSGLSERIKELNNV